MDESLIKSKNSIEEKSKMPLHIKFLLIMILIIINLIFMIVISYFMVIYFRNDSGESNQIVRINSSESEVMDFGEFTVNLKDIETRYLILEIKFELTANGGKNLKEVKNELKDRRYFYEDLVISILRNKTSIELKEDFKFEILKKELNESINKDLKFGKIKDIYFVKFLIQ